MKTMIKTDKTWSCHLFFFKAMKIPSPKPTGIEINIVYKLIITVGGSFSTKISAGE